MSRRTRSGVESVLAWLVGAGVNLSAGTAMSLPLNVAHRGYSEAFPENTLVAVEAGFAAGANVVEIDLLKSSDGEVVIFHDDTLDRTTNGIGRVDQTTLADLELLDAGSWFAPEFTGERIPTPAEAPAARPSRTGSSPSPAVAGGAARSPPGDGDACPLDTRTGPRGPAGTRTP